uniref:Uncharacterized protein n=1 Tax=Raoultella planticola TaxID=575 RepID=W8CTB2_RAOPL|nr:hypothetical protein pKpNDM1_00364 [Raoultella planticola]
MLLVYFHVYITQGDKYTWSCAVESITFLNMIQFYNYISHYKL